MKGNEKLLTVLNQLLADELYSKRVRIGLF